MIQTFDFTDDVCYNTEQYIIKKEANIMGLYAKGKKESITEIKKGFTSVLYEKKEPSPPRMNSPIYSKTNLCTMKKVRKKSKTNLSLFG